MYASGIASHVHGIEFSQEFRSELGKIVHEHPNVTVGFGDAFTMPFEKEKFDVLLMDITVSPLSSIKALENVLGALKSSGRLLLVVKLPKKRDRDPILRKLSSLGLEIIEHRFSSAVYIPQKINHFFHQIISKDNVFQ